MAKILRIFETLLRDRRGGVTVLSILSLIAVIACSSLAVEYGRGLLRRVENQRIADTAAYGGALVYNATLSTTAADSAVTNIMALNGMAGATASSALVDSPTGDGNQAVQVTVTTSDPLLLARVLTTNTALPVSATAYAELGGGAPGCVIALSSGGTGVTLSGGTSITAAKCAVASNSSVTVPCGTTITSQTVDYGSSAAPSEPCNGIQAPSGGSARIVKTTTQDPVSSNPAVNTPVQAAAGRLSTVESMTSPQFTVPSGRDVSFDYAGKQSTTASDVAAAGCTASFTSPVWTVSCGPGTYDFGKISLSGGITVNFNVNGSSAATYNFSGQIYSSGTALHFGPGTYNVAGGIATKGGSTTTFGAGTFRIGPSTQNCGAGNYSICNSGTSLTFGGPSSFTLASGIYNGGGSSLIMGSGSTNSFDIGKNTSGSPLNNSLYMGGGAITVFADATGASDVFEMAGNLDVASGGGSCLTVSAAAEHDINGFMATAGGTILGAGIYNVAQYVALGGNGGGDVTCNGVTVGMSGDGVTFVVGGTATASSGSCSGTVFCVAAGYGHVTLTAPSSGDTEQFVVIGPLSGSTAGATFAEGASNTVLSGAFYLPNGPVSLSGAATVGDNLASGQCLELIGSQVTLAGGTAIGTSCGALGGSSSGNTTVTLVQ